jgi:hypothetical protein
MAGPSVGMSEPIVHAPISIAAPWSYRTGRGMIPSAEWVVFHDDFVAAVTTNLPAGWDQAVIDTGATLVTGTTAGSLGATGVLMFDSDGAAEGVAVAGEKSLQLTAGKKFFMEMRFQTELADDSDVQFGLSDLTAVTNPEDLWTTTAASLISFGVLDGGSGVTGMLSDSANTGTSVLAGTRSLVSATWHTLAISYDGAGLKGWVDGQHSVTWVGVIPTGVALAPFFGFRNGSAATTEGHIDYFRYALER